MLVPGAASFHVWALVLAVSSAILGAQWDIAWHRSVGRDTFWSPPHIAIYFGGVLAGLACGHQILTTTFAGSQQARAAAVRVWGFCGPLGAFIAAWGGVAMLTAGPFDDWWHNAYGLDVKILSPPHTVLALGMFAIQLGALLLIASQMNRASARTQALLTALYLYIGGFVLIAVMTFTMEFTGRVVQHSGTFYRVVACAVPVILLSVGRASQARFGATAVAGVYTAVYLLLLWLFPLVPATPKLGPVYHPVTHLIPAGFPLLLLPPALALDLAAPRLSGRPRWLQALLLGLLFLLTFAAVQWPFAVFLLSPYARNWLVGTHYVDYNVHPSWPDMRNEFHNLDGPPPAFAVQMALAAAAACLGAGLGLLIAGWLRRLRR